MGERVRSEREALRLRAFLDGVVDSMPSMLVGVDAEGRITHWNREAEAAMRLPKQDVIGEPIPWL